MILRSMLSAAGWALRSLENPSTPLSAPDDWLYDALGSYRASSGINVNRETALTYASVWRAVNLLSRDFARTPTLVYKRQRVGRRLDTRHPAYRLLRYKPNWAMTAFSWKQVMLAHTLLAGNGYSYIFRDNAARPIELVPLSPDRTYPVRENGKLWYVTTVDQGLRKLDPMDVIHIKGLSYDGLVAYNVITKARESLGEGMAQQTWGSIFYRNNARPSIVLRHPGRLTPTAQTNLRESWERIHTGIENAHRVAVLQEGMDIKDFGFSADDAQFIESRKFTRIEVANWFGIPPHKLGDDSKIAYNSLEQENQSYYDESLGPWFSNAEEEFRDKLLTEEEKQRDSREIEFDRKRLVQAQMQVRGEYFTKAITTGWMNRDEARAIEGLNPIPEGHGEQFQTPLNTGTLGAAKDGDKSGSATGQGQGGQGGQPAALPPELLDLPDVRQSSDYDCGAAATRAVAQFFDVDEGATEEDFIAALGTTKRQGTLPHHIIAYLNSKKLLTTSSQEMTIEDLERFFASGHPVICCIQDYGTPEEERTDRAGHYVTVIGVGLGQVFFQDPSAGRVMWPVEQWLENWHDSDTLEDGTTVAWTRYGIAVGEELPSPATSDDDQAAGDGGGKGGSGTLDPDAGDDDDSMGEDVQREEKLLESLRQILGDTGRRMLTRLGTHLARAAREPGQFLAGVEAVLDEHRAVLVQAFTPPLAALAEVTGRDVQASVRVDELLGELREGLLCLAGECTAAELRDRVTSYLEGHACAWSVMADAWALRAKTDEAFRTVAEALDILERMPDVEGQAGEVAVGMPVDEDPPYQLGKQDLKRAKKKNVRVRELVATRATLKRDRVEQYVRDFPEDEGGKGDVPGLPADRPYVVKAQGKLYVHDGNHRILTRQLLGVAKTEVYYLKAREARSSPAAAGDGDDADAERAQVIAQILAAVLPAEALDDLAGQFRFDPNQPRDPKTGRWITSEGSKAAKGKASALIAAIKAGGLKDPSQAKQLADHLTSMTVKDLQALKKEHGLKASGTKSKLAAKLADKLHEYLGGDKKPGDKDAITKAVHNPQTGLQSGIDAVKKAGIEQHIRAGKALTLPQREKVSDLVHQAWMDRERNRPDGIRPEKQHLMVPYKDLPEVEKDKDRKFALAAMASMRPEGYWGDKTRQPYYRPGPNPTVDAVVTRDGKSGEKEILMIRRADKEGVAERGKWALPGGFHDTDAKKGELWTPGKETAAEAALRELKEETGLSAPMLSKRLRQTGTYEGHGRDPRDNVEAWSASTAFAVHVPKSVDTSKVIGKDDADRAEWVPLSKLKDRQIAFDHRKIIGDALPQKEVK